MLVTLFPVFFCVAYLLLLIFFCWLFSLCSLWQEAGFDALICPSTPMPAYPHGMSADLTISCSYTFLYNLLHYPAGNVPITIVKEVH